METNRLIIAIDGGAGTGTSTAAKGVAEALGIPLLNTGSMYRAIAWEAGRLGAELSDNAASGEIAEAAQLEYDNGTVCAINGRNVRSKLYSDGVGRGASLVSGLQRVRHAMVELQRQFGRENGVVMEGRDIGTNVFPDTPYRFYFVCDAKERVRRLQAGGRHDETIESLLERDRLDEAHEHGTFKRHEDAMEIDTTNLPPEGVVAKIVETVQRGAEA